MLCGGEVTVFIEPYTPKPILFIVGGGHIGQPLAEMARTVGYDIQVVDVQQERGDRTVLDPETITADTYAVIITEDHVTDERALRDALQTPANYIGMIGSKRKIGTIMEHLRIDGFTDDQLAPCGPPLVWIWVGGSRSRSLWQSSLR